MVLFHSRHFFARGWRTTVLLLALLLATGLGSALAGKWPEPSREPPPPGLALAPPGWPLVLAPLALNEYFRR